MSKKTVMLALSGGVDSSVCIELLKNEGYEVFSVVMKMSDAHEDTVLAAKKMAERFNSPLSVLDLREEFKEKIIIPFAQSYKNAKTPNPCIVCNPEIKFKYLLTEADKTGCDFIATGHYASVGFENGRYFIKTAKSAARDQSYMLYRLPQEILKRLILPLDSLEKSEVREKAHELNLECADAPDSVENCFIPNGNYAEYIENLVGASPKGNFISPDGKIVGEHKGIIHYTVGQRKGLNISLGQSVFIKKIDAQTNNIYLAYKGGDFGDTAFVEDCVYMCLDNISEPTRAEVKIRSTAKRASATIYPLESRKAKVVFSEPVKAIAAGQSAVFYLGDKVLGGGFIV